MKELSDFLSEYWREIVLVFSSIIAIISSIDARVNKTLVKRILNNARSNGSYLLCPHCGAKVKLKDVDNVYMATGAIDNDLDGKPDKPEKD